MVGDAHSVGFVVLDVMAVGLQENSSFFNQIKPLKFLSDGAGAGPAALFSHSESVLSSACRAEVPPMAATVVVNEKILDFFYLWPGLSRYNKEKTPERADELEKGEGRA
ncbi:hypothetical protein JCM17207_14570 [Faecalibacterium gallinarum]|uniref:Uncharacterized protein n=1 Tax=Faecalibacterium gallinarum TaxID=2903556 RepID=A0AA37MYQ8_9FIRM|nr:hypothetical protein JCM17207_14570 [Faecalibacterium gallinarum]